MPEVLKSKIYSEVEGTLDIENVPTTRRRFEELNGFYDFIDNNGDKISDLFEKLPLKSFNSKHIYFSKCREFDIQMHTFFDLLKRTHIQRYSTRIRK